MPDMLVKLYELPQLHSFIEPLNDQGIIIRKAMVYEKTQVVNWVRLLQSGWVDECAIAFSHHPVSCFIATQAGEMVGFACYDVTCKNFFGPTGVIEQKRGLGIGRALLMACLSAMAADGYAYAIIGGVGPIEYYEKNVGAVVIEGSSPGVYRDKLT